MIGLWALFVNHVWRQAGDCGREHGDKLYHHPTRSLGKGHALPLGDLNVLVFSIKNEVGFVSQNIYVAKTGFDVLLILFEK